MKKIVSAMALGALVLGVASADTKIKISYRNGMEVYTGTFKGDGNAATKTVLDQDGYNGGKDTVNVSATGDIFYFGSNIQPTVCSDTIVLNMLEFGAKLPVGPGTLNAKGGWWRDGQSNGNIRITKDASNFEGIDWEGAKPGSIFKNRPNTFVIDMTNMSMSDTLIGGIADYTLPTDAFTLKVLASVMSDRAAQKYAKDDFTDTTQVNAGAYSWGVNANIKVPGLVEVEALAKGNPKWNGVTNEDGDGYAGATAMALYAMPLMVENLNLAVGGSIGMVDGNLSDLAFDLRARYAMGNLSITSYNNISMIKENVASGKIGADLLTNGGLVKDIGPTAQTGTTALWNMLGFAYVVNPTITARLSVAQQTMLAREESAANKGDDYNLGMSLRVTPAVEITATKGASVLAGVTCAMSGIGADEETENKTTDWYWGIPVLLRVKM